MRTVRHRTLTLALAVLLAAGCGPLDTDAQTASSEQGLTAVLERHTIGSFSGVAHFGADSVPTDVSFIPPAGATTGAGKRPTTSILWNWTGNSDSPAGAGAYSTGAERNEKAIGGSYGEGGIYWLDFWVFFDPSTTNTNVVDWNYIMQHRSNGSTPSPAPCIGILGNGLILRRNISGYGSTYDNIGDLDEGGSWHHYQVGYRWSVSASTGWVEVWRDDVNVLPRKAVRTAFDTSSGATLRFGGGYRNPSITGPVKYWLWGLELHSSRPTSNGTVPPTPSPTTPSVPAAPSISQGPSGSVTSQSATFAFSSTTASVSYQCQLDGAPFTACASPVTYGSMNDGAHTFAVRAVNSAGPSTSTSRTWSVSSTTSPVPPSPSTGRAGVTEPGPRWLGMGAHFKRVSQLRLNQAASIGKLVVYVDGNGSGGSDRQLVRGIIYRDNNGAPSTLLARTTEVTVRRGDAQRWVELSFASSPTLEAGVYWVGLHSGAGNQVARYAYAPTARALRFANDDYTNGTSSPFGTFASDDRELSLYAELGAPSATFATGQELDEQPTLPDSESVPLVDLDADGSLGPSDGDDSLNATGGCSQSGGSFAALGLCLVLARVLRRAAKPAGRCA